VRIPDVETPRLTDGVAKEKTGKTLKEWFAALDAQGGLDAGRRALVDWAYAETGKDEWWATTLVVEYEKARGQEEKDGAPRGYSICATKTIAAPLSSVFAAFGDARALSAWLGPKAKVALEEGGALETADGDRATFGRVRADKDLRMTWEREDLAPGTAVEVVFADKGKGKTGITLNHTRIRERADADRVRAAWREAFERLQALLEKR
jgi:uncharacterized protein YndB with AHSA1/START domain